MRLLLLGGPFNRTYHNTKEPHPNDWIQLYYPTGHLVPVCDIPSGEMTELSLNFETHVYELKTFQANDAKYYFYKHSSLSLEQSMEILFGYVDSVEVVGRIAFSKGVAESKLLNFDEMEPLKLYKNKYTFDDQWYIKMPLIKGYALYSCSAMSNYKLSLSSADKNGRSFVPFNEVGTKRV